MFQGIHTALVTPFRDGDIDQPALEALVEFQIAAGVDGIVPCGSTGESATLSHAEHERVVEIVVGAAAGRVKVIAGAGSNSTREAIEFTAHARDAGADGALLLSPYYNKPTQEGIVAHYAAIAKETRFPLVVYNIPGRTASNIQPDTMVRMAENEFIVAAKEACGDIDQIAHVLARCPDDFSVLAGDDSYTLPLLSLGGAGVISTSSNVVPSRMCDLVRSFQAGDLERAQAVHFELLPLFDILFIETNPICVKAALALMGKIDEEIRLPLTSMTQRNHEHLEAILKEGGLLS